ncbi:hypothetical protein NYE70_23595 [Paenibacillus sp. FSL R5-0407]|uniref:hypothetical protein n=1 Tax=Paenibacillus sp. FSL R5-0407 TaxID=2975320 RepID=UPI0030F72FCF
MATATYNYGIRDALNQKGVDNARIGYANGYVTIDGKNFIKADASNNGRALTSQQNFDSTWSQYSQPAKQANPMVQAASTAKTTPQATYTPPTSPTVDTLGRINDFINKQAQFQYTAPDPFSYDQNSDPAYQSQLAEAKRNVENQQIDTNAMLRASGQGQSSWSETVANQIGTNAMKSIANDLVPALMQQAYQRYNDDANRSLQVQQLNYGVGQDALGNLSNLYGLQDNEYFQKPIAEAQLTGNYLPTEARQVINQILGLKQQAEAQGVTAQERAGLSQQADILRGQLQALGIDPSLYGSNVNYNSASKSNAGIRTLAGQQLDMARSDQAFSQNMTQEQFAYQKARDAISDKQWKMQFDEAVRQNGLSYGLNLLQEQNQQAYREASLALSQDDNARAWAQLDYSMMNPASTGSTGGLTANQVLQSMKSLYTEPVYAPDGAGGQEKIGNALTKDAAKREQMFLNVVDSGLSDAETNQILNSLGMTKTEIDGYMKKYGASSGN